MALQWKLIPRFGRCLWTKGNQVQVEATHKSYSRRKTKSYQTLVRSWKSTVKSFLILSVSSFIETIESYAINTHLSLAGLPESRSSPQCHHMSARVSLALSQEATLMSAALMWFWGSLKNQVYQRALWTNRHHDNMIPLPSVSIRWSRTSLRTWSCQGASYCSTTQRANTRMMRNVLCTTLTNTEMPRIFTHWEAPG